MNEQTKENLLAAMEGEAMAYARYMLSARVARENGHDELAHLYEETAEVELHEHFAELAELAWAFRTEADTLLVAIEGERYEAEILYPRYAQQAAAAGELATADRFLELARDERSHLEMFEQQLETLQAHA